MPIPLPDDQLPVELPEIDDYSPRTFDPDDANTEPEPPLSRATEWVVSSWTWATAADLPRETNTMPQWAGSCWYELRYLDPDNHDRSSTRGRAVLDGQGPARPAATPAASTCTSAASSTRCCTCCTPGSGTRCCTTWARSSSEEPFRRLFNQGYIQAFAYTDARGTYVPAEEVVEAVRRHGRFHVEQRTRRAGSTGRWASR